MPELDACTAGFRTGQLWVITGSPEAGKTTLLTQFVHLLATSHEFAVHFHTASRDSIDETRARLLTLALRMTRRTHADHDWQADLPDLQRAALAALTQG